MPISKESGKILGGVADDFPNRFSKTKTPIVKSTEVKTPIIAIIIKPLLKPNRNFSTIKINVRKTENITEIIETGLTKKPCQINFQPFAHLKR